MHQQPITTNVVDMLTGDFEILNGVGAGARGDGGQSPDLTVDRYDLFQKFQFTRRDEIVASHTPERVCCGYAEGLAGN
jgi:hypothetical protein